MIPHFPFLFLFILFFSSNIQGEHIYIKMSLGFFSGGGINDSLSHPEYAPYIALDQQGINQLGGEFSLDLFYQVNSHLSFSLGGGYLMGRLKGNEAVYFNPTDLGPTEFNLYPRLDSTVYSVCLSALYSFPLNPSFQINVLGGIGYYFGSFEHRTDWYASLIPLYENKLIYKSQSFKGNANTLGTHLGAGFDLETTENIFLSFDVLYRIVDFKNLEIRVPTDMKTPQFYFGLYESRDLDDFSYQIQKISMGGILIRFGLKCRF
ncbi:MAG: outer membrane beta-barrel protein [Acidobacteriota bacterium]